MRACSHWFRELPLYRFTCMGLHLCVYMFLLLQVCKAEPHFRYDKLLKISFTLTWPAAVVWIAGFRYFQDGMVHQTHSL